MRTAGLNAAAWDSGGSTQGVGINRTENPSDGFALFFGTAGSTWAGEVLDDGEVVGAVETAIPSESEEVDRIADGIVSAIADFMAKQQQRHQD